MHRATRRAWPLMTVLFGLSACAINQLRVESARGVAGAATVATAATRSYLDQVDAAQVRVSLDLIALDPNCTDRSFVQRTPQLALVRDPAQPPRGWLCRPQASAATFPQFIRIGPVTPELEPTLAAVDALGAYGAAITDMLDEEAPDPAKQLADAFELARSAELLLRTGFGGTALVPAADDKRLIAVTGFISLIATLDRERDQVRRLRIIASETDSTALIAALREHLSNWETSRKSSAGLSYVIAGTLYGHSARVDPPLPAAVRRAYAAAYYSSSAPLIQNAKLHVVLDRSLGELADTDIEYRAALADYPRLSAKQKKRLRELTRARLIAVFSALTNVITAAKGI